MFLFFHALVFTLGAFFGMPGLTHVSGGGLDGGSYTAAAPDDGGGTMPNGGGGQSQGGP